MPRVDSTMPWRSGFQTGQGIEYCTVNGLPGWHDALDLKRNLLNTQACMPQAQLDMIRRCLNEIDSVGRE